MSLTLPSAGITPGRSADLRVATPTIGADIARLGQVMTQVGNAVEDERNDRLLQTAQLDMMEGFNSLRLELDQNGDPESRNALFQSRSAELQAGILGALPESLRDRAGLRFRELQIRTGYAEGREQLGLIQSARRAELMRGFEITQNTAALGAPEDREAASADFDAMIERALAGGVITPEQAQAQRDGWNTTQARTRAEAMLRDDPAALVTALDSPDLAAIDAPTRENWRTRAQTRIDQQSREELTALNRMAGEGLRVIHSGSQYTATEALLSDPRLDQTENGAALRAAAEFQRAEPRFFALTPAAMREALAERQRQPIAPGDGHEIAQRQVMTATIEAAEAEWARDPIGRGMRVLGLRDTTLPNPATTADDVLVSSLTARAVQAQTLAGAGYTTAPVLFRPEERAAWAEATAVTADPEQRARLASIAAQALGDDAELLARQVSDDPVFGYVGGMIAAIGESAQPLARSIFEGQRAIANGDVPLPSEAARRQFWFQNFEGLFDNFTETGLRDQVIGSADALAALRLRSHPDAARPETRQQVWLQSAHEAMGGTGSYGARDARGGVQTLRGVLTIMPAGINAGDVHTRMEAIARGLSYEPGPRAGGGDSPDAGVPDLLQSLWRSASATGAAPTVGGEPINGNTLRALTFQAYRDGTYLAFYTAPNEQTLLLTGEDGRPFRLDLRALMEWQP